MASPPDYEYSYPHGCMECGSFIMVENYTGKCSHCGSTDIMRIEDVIEEARRSRIFFEASGLDRFEDYD